MENKRQRIILIIIIIMLITCVYVLSFFIHKIVDRGAILDGNAVGNNTQNNHVQGVEDENTNNTQPNGNNSQNNNTGDNGNNGNDGNNVDNNNNNSSEGSANNDDNNNNAGNNNNNENNNNNGDNGNSGNTGDNEQGEIVDNKDRIRVLQDGRTNWNELKVLDIFKNSYFNDKSIIAPGVQGSYNFTVENISKEDCLYDIVYSEENIYQINMVFRLKKNGQYIVGNESNWVKCDKLSTKDTLLKGNVNDVYTIEWKWKDNANDTQIGETSGANYKMLIRVFATQKEGV